MKSIYLILFIISSFSSTAQVIYGTNNYIEYHQGTLPVVISVAHGGNISPTNIPDRVCNNPTLVTDANTIELAKQIDTGLFALTGCHPHIIYCKLKRTKLDCNRNLADGACGNSDAVIAWTEFHHFIDTAELLAQNQSGGKAFYIDLHGHGHTIQQLELGYLLNSTELGYNDSTLNTNQYIGYSSIQNLVANNVNNYSHAQLLRGSYALGTLLTTAGYPSVPSQQVPSPGSNPYFEGGYNTANYTSYATGKTVNGLQIECNYNNVRDSYASRKRFGDSLSTVLVKFLKIHQNINLDNCSAILPVTLINFIATTKDCYTEINWQAIHEQNNKGFYIEHSSNGHTFIPIAFKEGMGNNDQITSYQYKDLTAEKGSNFYRLKQISYDGKISYSKIIFVNNTCSKKNVTIYPNPVTTTLTIKCNSTSIKSVSVYNIYGQKVKEWNNKLSLQKYEVSDLCSGTYTVIFNGIQRMNFIKL